VSKDTIELLSDSVAGTIQIGQIVGQALLKEPAGSVIALIGQLGSGKTHFIKGLALGLEVPDADAVTSPTFTLINEYEGLLMLCHIDAYRLESSAQLEALGFDELCIGASVVVVEWADKVYSLIEDYRPIVINLEHRGPNQRALIFTNIPRHIGELLCQTDCR